MTSLRMRVVEAGARVITIDMDTWEEGEIAAVVLDAMLDCLTENLAEMDGWKVRAEYVWANDMLAELREDR